jgi:hypothetical protein
MLPVVTKISRKDPLAHCYQVTLVTAPDVEPQVRDTTPQLLDVTAAARPNLSDAESHEFKEITEYNDIFTMRSDDYGRPDKANHRINTMPDRFANLRGDSLYQNRRIWAKC